MNTDTVDQFFQILKTHNGASRIDNMMNAKANGFNYELEPQPEIVLNHFYCDSIRTNPIDVARCIVRCFGEDILCREASSSGRFATIIDVIDSDIKYWSPSSKSNLYSYANDIKNYLLMYGCKYAGQYEINELFTMLHKDARYTSTQKRIRNTVDVAHPTVECCVVQ